MTAYGRQTPQSGANDYNTLIFTIQQQLLDVQTSMLCQVQAVSNDGGVAAVGFVTVQPMVNQMTGNRQAVPHGPLYNVPYMRLQGGTNAVIMDPVVGDIGLAVFASRDISAVKTAKAPANPGSFRVFDYADGLFFGGFLNGTPTQYIRFSASGIDIVSPTATTIEAPANTVEGPLTVTEATILDTTLNVTGLSTLAAVDAAAVQATSVTTPDLSVSGAGATVTLPAASLPGTVLETSGVTPGTYTSTNLTVNAEGLITAAADGSGGGGGGTVTSVALSNTDGLLDITGTNPVTISGTIDVNASTAMLAALNAALSALQPVSGLAGSYTSADLTINTSGQITAASNGSGGGGSNPWNQTPETHVALPTGVGLGPNDEFEYGTSIDTTGARYAGATPWVALNIGTVTAPIANGCVNFTSPLQGGLQMNGYMQPIAAGVGRWRCSMPSMSNVTAAPYILAGMFVYSSGTGALYDIIKTVGANSGQVDEWASPTSYSAAAANWTAYSGTIPIEQPGPLWLEIERDSTNYYFRYSFKGFDNSFVTVYTLPISSFTSGDHIGIYGSNSNSSNPSVVSFDWFRQEA
jgi:hypothetical protein